MISEAEVIAYYEDVNQVVALHLQGFNASEIAAELKMKRADVMSMITEWKSRAGNNEFIQEQARSAITKADEHWSMATKELWLVADEAGAGGDLKLRKDSIVAAANVEEKRINMLQKAGLLTDQDVQLKLQESQRQQTLVIQMLKEVASEHPEIREKILSRLSKIFNEPQGIEA